MRCRLLGFNTDTGERSVASPHTSVVVIMFLAFALLAPLRAECPTPTLPDDFVQSDSIFIGRAIARSVISNPPVWGRAATETTFEVERMWKGESTKTVRVLTCGGTIGDQAFGCGESFEFTTGTRYLVFASGKPLTTNTCRHTSLAERAGETLQWLADKPSRTRFERDKIEP